MAKISKTFKVNCITCRKSHSIARYYLYESACCTTYGHGSAARGVSTCACAHYTPANRRRDVAVWSYTTTEPRDFTSDYVAPPHEYRATQHVILRGCLMFNLFTIKLYILKFTNGKMTTKTIIYLLKSKYCNIPLLDIPTKIVDKIIRKKQ